MKKGSIVLAVAIVLAGCNTKDTPKKVLVETGEKEYLIMFKDGYTFNEERYKKLGFILTRMEASNSIIIKVNKQNLQEITNDEQVRKVENLSKQQYRYL